MSAGLRRAGVVVAGGSAYLATVYLTYNYLSASQADRDRANERLMDSGGTKSFVNDPNRTDTFQQIAYAYDDQIDQDEFVMGINLMRRWMLFHHAKGEVLEVGAGTGRNLKYYPGESTVSKILLTDTSDKMLLRAQEKLKRMSVPDRRRHELLVADAADLSAYPDASFDTVVDTFGLCSFDDPVAVLRELGRVCKPGGKILLLEHGRSKRYEGLSKYLDKNAERHAKNWGCCWNRDIDVMLENAGLEIDNLTTWHFGTTYYAVCSPRDGAKDSSQSTKRVEGEVLATSCCSESRTVVSPWTGMLLPFRKCK